MGYSIKGEIHAITDEQRFSDKFAMRTLVLYTPETNRGEVYDKYLAIDFPNAAMSKLDGLRTGETVTAHFNIDSREHNGKWYTSARGWKVEINQDSAPTSAPAQTTQSPMMDPPMDDDSPLPF